MRFFPSSWQRWNDRDAKEKALLIVAVVALFPVFAFALDWRIGLFVSAAWAALGFGVWRVSKQR